MWICRSAQMTPCSSVTVPYGPSMVMPGVPSSTPDSRTGGWMPSLELLGHRDFDLRRLPHRAEDAHVVHHAFRTHQAHAFFTRELARLRELLQGREFVAGAEQSFDVLLRQVDVMRGDLDWNRNGRSAVAGSRRRGGVQARGAFRVQSCALHPRARSTRGPGRPPP